MKHWTAFIVIALISIGAIYWAEHKKVDAQASPEAMMYFIADSERELTRLPMAMTKISDEEEIKIGDEMASSYTHWRKPDQETSEDREIREYIEQVGARVAANANRKLPYKFHYIPEPYFVNAFALPGGHVFIGQGLINLMDSEDELANVLGHEVEHIDLKHCVERVQIEARMRHFNLGVAGALASIPVEIFQAGYSKEQELAADRVGTRLAVSGKYSPEGAVRMFEKFEQFEPGHQPKPGSPQEEMATVALSSLTEYFRSHPPSAMRAEQIRRLIADEKWPVTKETDLKIAYLRYNGLAQSALDARKYKEAIQYAKRSLAVHPRQSDLVRIIGRAQFMQGEFESAAESFKTLLTDYSSAGTDDEHSYADALGAMRSKQAAADFDAFASHYTPRSDLMTMTLRVDRAGVHLVAGDTKLATGLDQELTSLDKDYSPELLARLAWWYYRAGNSESASVLFDQVIQLRPQEGRYRLAQAWVQIEQHRYADALDSGHLLAGYPAESNAVLASAFWLSDSPDSALREFEPIASDPSWSNRHWVQGNYSPTVVAVIDQMKQEREKRLTARKK